ncbi:transporter substrate-binding domain-containing protein [Solwaraspora sp. WMMD1047]|uniref:transporter substrate-binding domain-containing protein n=1 Tax=Solwaraspora sp. WMMD1047 TaxID=3016102 RepID=UPI0024175794|nr:transporter substrate-binding domain-containing protein [Solwaraspora sp. WMMD1047]MDG4834355.1 transporter substrate-binding domain-containing protein [Solwaraspora sp. WMMD1047]
MSSRTLRTARVLPLVLAVVVASACGSSDDNSDDEPTVAGTAAPFFDQLPEEIKQRGSLTWVGDIQAPLRMQESANAPLTGVQPDFAAAMEKLLGVKIEQPVVSSFADVIPSIQSGRYDMAWGGLAVTPEREQTFDVITWTFSVPTFVYDPAENYTSAQDLCGRQLAHVAGSAPFEAAFETLKTVCSGAGREEPKAFELGSRADLQVALTAGRVDAYFTTPIDAAYAVKQAPDRFKYIILRDEPFRATPLAAEMNKGNDQLRDAIFGAMKQLWTDGTYESIMTEWGLQDAQIDAPLLNPLTGGGAAPSPSASS